MSNQITLTGHLGSDAELAYSPQGDARLTFSVADDLNRKGRDGQWEKVGTTWWRCTAWKDQAEALAPLLVKGAKVVVTGRAVLREYETRDGQPGKALEVRVDQVGVVPRSEPRQQQADPWAGGASDADPANPPF